MTTSYLQRGPRFPWQISRRSIIAALTAYLFAGALAGYAQYAWGGWFFAGHSVSLFIVVSLAAVTRGTLMQAWAVCSAGLIAAVLAFFASWSLADQEIAGQFYPPLVLTWCVVALPTGLILAAAALLAYRHAMSAGIGIGLFLGLLVGDVITNEAGVPWHSPPVYQTFTQVLLRPDALGVIGFGGALLYLCWMLYIHRDQLRVFWTAPIGLFVGYLAALGPYILLYVVL